MRLFACLTTIPPRFDQLPRVVAGLRAQRVPPEKIFLSVPRQWRRFAGDVDLPPLDGVDILRCQRDRGPGLKFLEPLARYRGADIRLLLCDDDWFYGPDWAAQLCALSKRHPGAIITGAGYGLERLTTGGPTPATAGTVDIAQGYSGVLLSPDQVAPEVMAPPPCAWAVDDIWLSAMAAKAGTAIIAAPRARAAATPLDETGRLQDEIIDGWSRDGANRATVAHVQKHFGIWI